MLEGDEVVEDEDEDATEERVVVETQDKVAAVTVEVEERLSIQSNLMPKAHKKNTKVEELNLPLNRYKDF